MKDLFLKFKMTRLGALLFPSQEAGGLEITDDWVKLLYLENREGGSAWKYFASRPLPQGTVVDGKVQKQDLLVENLKQLFGSIVSAKKISPEVVVTIPEAHLYVQSVTIPAGLDSKIVGSVIMNNPLVTFPTPVAENYLSWQVIATKGLEKKILVALGRKEIIDPYEESVLLAGLKPVAIHTPSIGFELSLSFPEDCTILYFLEQKGFTKAIYLGDKLFFKHSDEYAHHHFEKQELGLEDIADLIIKDFPATKDFILSELGEDKKIHIMLTSCFDVVSPITEIFKKKNFPVETVSINNTQIPQNVSPVSPWMGVLGAAARGILPKRDDEFMSFLSMSPEQLYVQEQKLMFFSRALKLVFSAFAFCIVTLAVVGLFISSIHTGVNREFVRNQAIQLPSELVKLEEEMNKFNASIEKVTKIKEMLYSSIPFLKSTELLAYKDIKITNFDMSIRGNKSTVTLSGVANTRDRLLAFKSYLEEQQGFADIVIPLQSLEQRENINFSLTYTYAL